MTPAPSSPTVTHTLPANPPWPLHPPLKLAEFSFWSRNPCPFSIAPLLCALQADSHSISSCPSHAPPLPFLFLGCCQSLLCDISVSPSHVPCLISGHVGIGLYLATTLSFSGTYVSCSPSDSEASPLMLLSSVVTATLHTSQVLKISFKTEQTPQVVPEQQAY